MKFSEFIRRQMSENGEPSNNRVMAFLFVSSVMILVLGTVFVPVFRPDIKLALPVIPPSFETFVEYCLGILVLGSAVGKGINAYKDKGSDTTTTTKTETIASVKGATDGSIPPAT